MYWGQLGGNEHIFTGLSPYVTSSLAFCFIFYSSFICYLVSMICDFTTLSFKDVLSWIVEVSWYLFMGLYFSNVDVHPWFNTEIILFWWFKKMEIYLQQMTSWLKSTALKTLAWISLEKQLDFFPLRHYFLIRHPSDISKWLVHFQKLFQVCPGVKF